MTKYNTYGLNDKQKLKEKDLLDNFKGALSKVEEKDKELKELGDKMIQSFRTTYKY